MIHQHAYITLFMDDFTHPSIILLLTAEASLGVLNRIGFA